MENFRNLLKWVAIGTFIHLHTVYDNGNYAIWRDQFIDLIPIIWNMVKYITEIILVFYILFLVCKFDLKKIALGPLAADIPVSIPLHDESPSKQDESSVQQEAEHQEHVQPDMNKDTVGELSQQADTATDKEEKSEVTTDPNSNPKEQVLSIHELDNSDDTEPVTPSNEDSDKSEEMLDYEEPGYDLYKEAIEIDHECYEQCCRERLELCGTYVRSKMAIYMSYKDVNTLMTNIQHWHKKNYELIEPIVQKSNIPEKQLCSIDLYHLAWNIGQCFGWDGESRAEFIKACFPDNLKKVEVNTIRLNLRKQGNCKIEIIDLRAKKNQKKKAA